MWVLKMQLDKEEYDTALKAVGFEIKFSEILSKYCYRARVYDPISNTYDDVATTSLDVKDIVLHVLTVYKNNNGRLGLVDGI